jgi:nicotinamidase-related amidase
MELNKQSGRTIAVADRTEFKATMNEALVLEPESTAVLTIDLQREYLDPAVGQAVVDPTQAERVSAGAKRMLDEARSRGIPVVHAYVVRRPDEVSAGIHSGGLAYTMLGRDLGASQLPHAPVRTRPDRVAGSPEAEVPAAMVAETDVHVITKKGLDSFAHTDLDYVLRNAFGATTLLLMGINTDTCVYSTTFSAANLGYRPVVVSDGVASMRGQDSHEMALELMARSIAWVLDIDTILAKLDG